jgi:hypothetical protein
MSMTNVMHAREEHPRGLGARAMRLALWIILTVSMAGAAFAGALTFRELKGAGSSCAAAGSVILGLPSCVYGFLMFVFIAAMAGWGLLDSARPSASADPG